MIAIPRLLIAGTHSGVGKTTVALAVTAALRERGLTVQAFKAGPDYLDPSHHTQLTGRPARNLDTWLLRDHSIHAIFQHAVVDADLAVVEGMMGLFDGHAATDERGSSGELAKLLQLPVILVVDGSHMARSLAALVHGFAQFDPLLPLAGVIINRVREGHFKLLRHALAGASRCPVLGFLPPDDALTIPERHLGLVPSVEVSSTTERRDRLAQLAARTIDLDRIVRIASAAPALTEVPWPAGSSKRSSTPVRIGVARDAAFHFYYQENLELLERFGAELVTFSPLVDQRVPEADALYLGGGFPEQFAAPLAENAPMRESLRSAIDAGLPTYAECGGLMYLAQTLIDNDGRAHAMVGALPGAVRMTTRLQSFGYATVIPRRATILANARDAIKGHEFHYSVWDHHLDKAHAAYDIVRRPQPRRLEGYVRENLLASYIHVHFFANLRWARGFVRSAQRWRQHMTT